MLDEYSCVSRTSSWLQLRMYVLECLYSSLSITESSILLTSFNNYAHMPQLLVKML